MAQKGLWNLARERRLQDRGVSFREEGDVVREYQAMHAKNFLSTWLREDVVGQEERRKKVDKKIREDVSRKEKRKGGKDRERDSVCEKRVC